MLDALAQPAPRTVSVRETTVPSDVESGAGAALPADWLVLEGAPEDARILYLHGGGYVAGSRRSHRSLAGRIARAAGLPLLLLDYRLAPEHPFPAALDDARAALDFVHAHGPGGAAPARRVVLCGDSAGGGLALATLVRARDEGGPPVAACATMSAWTDLAATGESVRSCADDDPYLVAAFLSPAARLYAGDTDVRHPLVSPLYAELRGLPPLLLHAGDHEILRDDSVRLAERARAAGVDAQVEVWPEMFHVWHAFYGALPEAREAVARLGAFLRAHALGAPAARNGPYSG